MKREINKIIVCLTVSFIACLSFVFPVYAHYSDTEASESKIVTGTLKINLKDSSDFAPKVKPGVPSIRTIELEKAGTIDFVYTVSVENVSGDLCSNLNLKDDTTNTPQDLTSFLTDKIDFSVKPSEIFSAELISDAAEWQNKSCSFELVFKASQKGLTSGGFVDEKRISSTVTSDKWIINPGDIVINELMWMGSYLKSKDEWIELKNTTSYDLDISGFQITKLIGYGLTKQEVLMLTIPDGIVIPANGFFLISRFSESDSRISITPNLIDTNVDLRDANLQIKVYKADWNNSSNLIDTADDGNGLPAAGYEGLFFHLSMERNDIPGNGANESSWHTCLELLGTRPYWDHPDLFNLGTPNDRNLSDESDADLAYFIEREQELLAEKEYVPDLEIGQDDGLLLMSEPSGSLMLAETPPIEEEDNNEGVNEVVDTPETAEIKPEEPLVLEDQEEGTDDNSEPEIVLENQITDDGAQDSGDTNTDGANTDQNNITLNETDEII